jgi:hypothetical protein
VDAFSYLSVLLSIIIGLGLTHVLTAAGRLIRHRDRVRFDWLSLLWAAVLLVVFVQVWWAMFGLRAHEPWTFLSFFIVLLQTATTYLMAAVVLPEEIGETGVDLRAYYDLHHRWFFGFFIVTLVVSVVKDIVLSGELPAPLNLGFHFVLGSVCASALVIRSRRYHEIVGVGSALLLASYIGVLFTRLA